MTHGTKRRIVKILGMCCLALMLSSNEARSGNQWISAVEGSNSQITSLKRAGHPVGTTIHRRIVDQTSPFYGTEVCAFVANEPSHAHVSLKIVKREGRKDEIYSSIANANDIAMINGGFWGYDATGKKISLGMLKSGGKQITPLAKWSTGGLLSQIEDRISIVPVSNFTNSDVSTILLQSKPILVWNGASAITTNDAQRFDRTAIGLDKSGRLILIGIFSPDGRGASLSEFALLLSTPSAAGGFDMREALAMDGGPGAYFLAPQGGLACGDKGKNFVPNAVSVSF